MTPDELGIFEVDPEDIGDDSPEIVAGMERLAELRALDEDVPAVQPNARREPSSGSRVPLP